MAVKKIDKNMVIDADALKAVNLNKIKNSVLTPHKKEFDILIKNSKTNDFGNNVILKKSAVDEIIFKNRIKHIKTGCDRMAVAGTGDILAGLAAGLLAKGYSPEKSAKMAAEISGNLGNLAKKEFGNHFIASDIIDLMKKAFQ